MPKTSDYIARESRDGRFTLHVNKDVNTMLDLYCKITQKNKTQFANELLRDKMTEIFSALK